LKPLRVMIASLLLIQFASATESLRLRIDGDHLRVTAPGLHFVTGHPLERLRNGAAVNYVLEMTVRNQRAGRILARVSERFTISYDLWEEKFAVSRQAVPARSASNLSSSAAEAWCIENLSIPVAQLPVDRSFWIAVEYASEAPRDSSRSVVEDLSLGNLVDILSRRPHDDPEIRGVEEVGPIRLEDLRKKQ
jgi:hypothetical protein